MTKKYFLGAINVSILIAQVILLAIGISTIGFYNKTKNIIIISSLLIISIILIYLYFAKNYKKYNTGVFITLMLNIVLAYQIINLNNTYSYLSNILNKKYEYVTYNLYVQKANTKYNSVNKLENKKIGLLKTNKENIKSILNKKVKIEYIEYNNIDEISNGIKNGEIQGFIIDKETKEELNKNEISSKIRSIYENRVKKSI